jgi:hypothetical protein
MVPQKVWLVEGYYEYIKTLYLRSGVKGFALWTEAKNGDLIYTSKELKLIEREMHRWISHGGDVRLYPEEAAVPRLWTTKDVEKQERKLSTYEGAIGCCLISGVLALQCKIQKSIGIFWK